MSRWERLADLPLVVEGYSLSGLSLAVSSGFERHTTVVTLHGAGEEGIGEDVVYDEPDQIALQQAGPVAPLAGEWTLGDFAEHVEGLDLFPTPPVREVSPLYRRWTFQGAALDLALRQAGVSLHEHLGAPLSPLTFVVSLRLGDPPTLDPLLDRLADYPGMRFKLDPTTDWDDELIAAVAELGVVDTLDMKGRYHGTVVDQEADPDLYRRLLDAFPEAWIEDPHDDPRVVEILRAHRDRVTWDAVVHSPGDIEALAPRAVNIKPSRMGGLRSLMDAYDLCEAHGIAMYGGGQFELGPGRGHIEYLASMVHPDTPNDVAPLGFHAPRPDAGLATSPLEPAPTPTGFRWS